MCVSSCVNIEFCGKTFVLLANPFPILRTRNALAALFVWRRSLRRCRGKTDVSPRAVQRRRKGHVLAINHRRAYVGWTRKPREKKRTSCCSPCIQHTPSLAEYVREITDENERVPSSSFVVEIDARSPPGENRRNFLHLFRM